MIPYLLISFAQLTSPTSANVPNEIKEELKKLEGTWIVVNVETNGELRPAIEVGEGIPKKLKLTAEKIDSLFADDPHSYSIDPRQKPKHMDVLVGKDKNAETFLWIYSVEGDDLRLAFTFDLKLFGGESDKSRPKSFETKDNKVVVINLKREKKK